MILVFSIAYYYYYSSIITVNYCYLLGLPHFATFFGDPRRRCLWRPCWEAKMGKGGSSHHGWNEAVNVVWFCSKVYSL